MSKCLRGSRTQTNFVRTEMNLSLFLDRTFPAHPYFSQQVGVGQFALFNLLKVYSNLDPELGYCQGLSFVAGLLLMHVSRMSVSG